MCEGIEAESWRWQEARLALVSVEATMNNNKKKQKNPRYSEHETNLSPFLFMLFPGLLGNKPHVLRFNCWNWRGTKNTSDSWEVMNARADVRWESVEQLLHLFNSVLILIDPNLKATSELEFSDPPELNLDSSCRVPPWTPGPVESAAYK